MQFDPYSQEFFEDPWEMYRWLREEAPCYHNEDLGFWAVSRYDDCVGSTATRPRSRPRVACRSTSCAAPPTRASPPTVPR
jgi:cytochrome P450